MSDEEEIEFKINEDYANRYNKWREKEELQKLKDRYGDVDQSGDDDSSSESEDEDAEGLTAQIEKDWLKTLAAIKSKDPKIYDSNIQFYKSSSSGEDDSKAKSSKKVKPMYLKDYDREVILKKEGKVGEYDDNSDMEEEDDIGDKTPGYYEEQEQIKQSIKSVIDSGSDDDDDDSGLLTKRKKTKQEIEKEEADYIEWLKGEGAATEQETQELQPLKDYWGNPELTDGEKFLRDFILNKKYLDEDDESVPTYEELTKEEDLSEEERELERQETFEHKYNFRFEEPDADFIKSYPRTVGDSLRRKDSRRAEKRQATKLRKQQEKEKRKEELKQLKNLKKREILSRIDTLKEITGNQEVGIEEDDLEGDFDPAEHDRIMQKVLSEDYYDEDVDEEKPVFDHEDLELDGDWDNWNGENSGDGGYIDDGGGDGGPYWDDPDFNMDADFDPNEDRELNASKKKRKKSKFKQALEKKKPVFDPGEKTFEEYFDEYYRLDYEDLIDDQPCRFKYRQTVANDFGLSTEEVMSAKDKELNQWVSVKKMSQYRTEEEERMDVRLYHKKAGSKAKGNILRSLAQEEDNRTETGEEGGLPKTLSPQKSKKKKASATVTKVDEVNASMDSEQEIDNEIEVPSKTTNKKRKLDADNDQCVSQTKKQKTTTEKDNVSKDIQTKLKKRKKKKNVSIKDNQTVKVTEKQQEKKKKKKKKKHKPGQMSDERLKAYGINPRKFKYTQKPL